ncbi:origin recognition complex subunit 1 [Guillardia theta CCMP2712]|uniref:Origin recognition complex subunit 1 n=1 Tax=Guillardia theta (strain CCMP2712) TaxID=905079 RepID=L1JY34_GUITC|nr:origin recognition complex subunit 1 [Guillardia theta CCMP2712]EKX53486.1 origin recognition complex subunit 1 [Guillardia theta CCMP2712]|eukprot:XP_005840466.1 origin recognition complex subunit 1 [Guillardia theta CCMP2712]
MTIVLGLRFYRPADLHCGKLECHGKFELFEGNSSDEIQINSVRNKVLVFTHQEYLQLPAAEQENGTNFFCRYHYDLSRKSFMPVLDSLVKKRRGNTLTKDKSTKDRLLAFSHNNDMSNALVETCAPETAPLQEKDTCKFARADEALQLSTTPSSLPCREGEHEEIKEVLRDAIARGKSGGCIYISGVPGTGKTASVHAVIKDMKAESDKGSLEPFIYIEINGQRLPKPNVLYSVLLQGLTGKKTDPVQAAISLDSYFGSRSGLRRPVCVLLVDELDYLITRKQTVLYNLFEWPTRKHARLIVLGGLRRITFAPYNHQQLQEIISSRLADLEAFDAKAVELCSRKVAAVSGDVRKALQLCRYACELARQDKSDFVSLKHIEMAVKQLFSNPYVAAVQGSSLLEKIVICSAVQLDSHNRLAAPDAWSKMKETGDTNLSVEHIHDRTVEIHRQLNFEDPPSSQLSAACARLQETRVFTPQGDWWRQTDKVAVNIQGDDVCFALRQDSMLASIASALVGF